MPTELPQPSRRLTRWHVVGMAIGYAAVTAVMVWVAVERASVTETVTTGLHRPVKAASL
jgi:hypothetical protein